MREAREHRKKAEAKRLGGKPPPVVLELYASSVATYAGLDVAAVKAAFRELPRAEKARWERTATAEALRIEIHCEIWSLTEGLRRAGRSSGNDSDDEA